MNRHIQLETLVDDLQQLIPLLQQDPTCPWTKAFLIFLEDAQSLLTAGYSQGELNNLSASVMHIFGGMGSFNDYMPFVDGKVAPWVKDFDRLSGRVYDDALSLRVVNP